MTILNLDEIVGQDAPLGKLYRDMTGNRLAHAYLFAGPVGVGRQTTATAIAKLLLCESPVSTNTLFAAEETSRFQRPCEACHGCRMMNGASHPDFHLIYKELAAHHDNPEIRKRKMQSLGIDLIRDFLIEPAGKMPTRGRGKYFVILETELMNIEAQNSLLKILEEPPDGVMIILICQNTELLLPTILSRCCLVRFSCLPVDFVADKLSRNGMDEPEARFWASFTRGSIGESLEFSRCGLFAIKKNIIGQIAKLNLAGDASLGTELHKITEKQAEALTKRTKKAQSVEMSKNLAIRRSTSSVLKIIASAITDGITVAHNLQRPLINSDQDKDIKLIASRLGTDRLTKAIKQLSTLEKLLWRNVQPKVVWDNVVITCASAAPLAV